MLLGTRMTNNEPSAITDLDVVARYDATDPNYVVKDSSNRISALLDKSKQLQTSTILNSGSLTVYKVYIIVATTVNYFGTGRIVGNMFVAATALALSANNSVREVIGNHITQTDITRMPIHTYDFDTKEWFALFDGVDDSLKSLPFTLNQPTSIYSCLKQNSWGEGKYIWDGNALNFMRLFQTINAGTLKLVAGYNNGVVNNTKNNVGSYDNIYGLYNNLNSCLKLNNLSKIIGAGDSQNSGGFTLGSNANRNGAHSHISVKEIIIKRISTDESDTIFNYFKKKHNVQY